MNRLCDRFDNDRSHELEVDERIDNCLDNSTATLARSRIAFDV
jgi:hypothetical protein